MLCSLGASRFHNNHIMISYIYNYETKLLAHLTLVTDTQSYVLTSVLCIVRGKYYQTRTSLKIPKNWQAYSWSKVLATHIQTTTLGRTIVHILLIQSKCLIIRNLGYKLVYKPLVMNKPNCKLYIMSSLVCFRTTFPLIKRLQAYSHNWLNTDRNMKQITQKHQSF